MTAVHLVLVIPANQGPTVALKFSTSSQARAAAAALSAAPQFGECAYVPSDTATIEVYDEGEVKHGDPGSAPDPGREQNLVVTQYSPYGNLIATAHVTGTDARQAAIEKSNETNVQNSSYITNADVYVMGELQGNPQQHAATRHVILNAAIDEQFNEGARRYSSETTAREAAAETSMNTEASTSWYMISEEMYADGSLQT